jgi:hypothetical protein
VYGPERTTEAIREKARHAFGRRDEPEEEEPGAELVPVERPLVAGEVRKEVRKPQRIDPLSLRPLGTAGFDLSAGEDRIRQRRLEQPTPVELIHRAADEHDLDEEMGSVYVALMRHGRNLNGKGMPPGWVDVHTNEETILRMIGGDPPKLQRGIEVLINRELFRWMVPGGPWGRLRVG